MAEEPDDDPAWRGRVRLGLAGWYAGGHRDLPWRRDRDPYRILVSETMLVQTTVAAAAPVLRAVPRPLPHGRSPGRGGRGRRPQGVGGPGLLPPRPPAPRGGPRDRPRPRAASSPTTRRACSPCPAWAATSPARSSPSPSTAPPRSSRPTPRRVLARLLAWGEDLAKSTSQKRLWQAAGRLVPEDEPGAFNQALMELGAVVCTPREPSCLICPVAAECRARALGLQDVLPVKSPKAAAPGGRRSLRPGPPRRPPPHGPARPGGALGRVLGVPNRPRLRRRPRRPVDRRARRTSPKGSPASRAFRSPLGRVAHTVKFGVTKHRVTLVCAPHDRLRRARYP